jgi:type I restriction enzyme S subunit
VRCDEKNAYPAVSDDEVLAVEIPVPSLPEQSRMMARIEQLNRRLDEARQLLRETEAELAAFTPALLAKAFQGNL